MNVSLNGQDANKNPNQSSGLSLSLDRTGANLGVSVDGANLANSHSVHGFSMNENFASDRTNNLILSRANEAFDAEMDARVLTAENDYLKAKTKPPMSDSELADLNKPENRANKEARLKQIGAVDPNNKAKTTSRITDESKAYGEIADGFRNLGAAFGIAGRASGQSGFVDADGKFHPRTCFVAGTLVTIVKREYRGTVISQLDSIEPDTRYEEKVAIETVKIGDYVLSWDETTKAKSYKKVTKLFHHEVELLYNLEIQSGEIIQTTWNHPFYVVREEINNRSTANTGGWVEAKDLKAGDKFLNSSGKILQLKSITQENQDELISVFNFQVDQTHTHYVGRDEVLTHNYKIIPVLLACAMNQGCRQNTLKVGGALLGLVASGTAEYEKSKTAREGGENSVDIEEDNQRNKKNNLIQTPPSHDTSIKPSEAADMVKKGLNPLDTKEIADYLRKYVSPNDSRLSDLKNRSRFPNAYPTNDVPQKLKSLEDKLKLVNRNYNENAPDNDPYKNNCASCAINAERTLATGRTHFAEPLAKRPVSDITAAFPGKEFKGAKNIDDLEHRMKGYGYGARGIVQVLRTSINARGQTEENGHSFNVVNDEGKIIFVDTQNKNNVFYKKEHFKDWQKYYLMRTENGK